MILCKWTLLLMLLRIGWLFPALMSTYGDRGNVICLNKRALWRGIHTEIVEITHATSAEEINSIDLFVGGGSQDKEQEIVLNLLKGKIGLALRDKLEKEIPALFVCGSLQIMGRSYQSASGKKNEGIGFFDCETVHPERKIGMPSRFTGHLIFEVIAEKLLKEIPYCPHVLGFENHRSSTYLNNLQPLGRVIQGYGNNGQDGWEGVFHKNAIGTYSHGPILPKNPFLADWLLSTALKIKYYKPVKLKPLEDSLSEASRQAILNLKLFSAS
jgi:lipid II isoglutaminyl synthase (glutamine-hydrolysing)